MVINMKMPDLATNEGAELGISRWIAEVGQNVSRGQPILEVETDKAVQEVECVANGVLQSILTPAGSKVSVGTIIATIKVG